MDATAAAWALFWATIALVVATAGGAMVVFAGLLQGTRVRREEVARLRRQQTMLAYLSTVDVRESSIAALPIDRDEQEVLSYIRSMPEHPERRLVARRYLNYWGVLATSAVEEVIDEQFLRLLAQNRVVAIWSNYQQLIQAVRAERADPKIYGNLEILAKRWGFTEQRALRADSGGGEEEE